MRVLYLLDSLNRGGVEMLALDVCRNARQNNLDLTFVATGGGLLEDDFKKSGVEFIRLNRRLPLDFAVVRQLRKVIKNRKIQIIHAHQAVEGLHAYFAALSTKARLVLSFQGFIPDAKNRLALKFLIPRARANVASSREFLGWLAEKEHLDTARNFHVVYNSVDEKRLASSGKNLRAELNLSSDTLLFGMTANFYPAPRKDQFTICRALPAFFARVPSAHFVFVGENMDGSDFEKCVEFCRQNEIAERAHFLGSRSDIADVLHSLDVFVLSSLHESFGIAAVEAMLVGLPTVLSDIDPLLEVSNNGEFAEIFKTGDHEELTEKLLLLAENAERRRELASRSQRWARQNFSIEAHLSSLKLLYETLT